VCDVQVPDDVYDSELSRFEGMLGALRTAGESRVAHELENDSPLKHVVSTDDSPFGVLQRCGVDGLGIRGSQ
jgi:hypothetical protein